MLQMLRVLPRSRTLIFAKLSRSLIVSHAARLPAWMRTIGARRSGSIAAMTRERISLREPRGAGGIARDLGERLEEYRPGLIPWLATLDEAAERIAHVLNFHLLAERADDEFG